MSSPKTMNTPQPIPEQSPTPASSVSEKPKPRRRRIGRAVGSVFSGSVLQGEGMRRLAPFLLGIAVLLVLYIAHTFHLQKLHLERQSLEREVRGLHIEAVHSTARVARQTRRSEITRRLESAGIPLQEFPHPVKTITESPR